MKPLLRIFSFLIILGMIVGCTKSMPTVINKTVPPTPASNNLEEVAKEFVDQLARGDYATARSSFTLTMANAVSADQLKTIWDQLTTQLGEYKQQTATYVTETGNYKSVYVTCQFSKDSIDIQVTYDAQMKIAGLHVVPAGSAGGTPTPAPYNPPAYVNPDSFQESEVTVGSGDWALPGTLTLPKGTGPFPAVVLVHGSGPNDRDESIGPNKPFRDLAWGLASQGIAVLRYDKRTKVYAAKFTPEMVAKLTVKEETTDDALLAVQLLRQTKNIDPKRIYVAGHSLGAMMAPRIGQQDPALAGLIILAGPARPLEDVVIDQYTYLYNLDGTLTGTEYANLKELKTQVEFVKSPGLSDQTPSQDLPLGIGAAYWLDLRGYEPAKIAETLNMRLLVLQGGRDYQVSPDKDFPAWKEALAGNINATLKLYPALNHLFIAGEGQPNPQEYNLEGHVSQEVVADIGQWVLK